MLFLITMIAAIGLSHIIVDGSILAKRKEDLLKTYKAKYPWLEKLMTCYQCSGFWTGALVGLFVQPINWCLFDFFHWIIALILMIPFYLIATPFIMGCAASYLSMVGAALLNYLDAPAIAAANKK